MRESQKPDPFRGKRRKLGPQPFPAHDADHDEGYPSQRRREKIPHETPHVCLVITQYRQSEKKCPIKNIIFPRAERHGYFVAPKADEARYEIRRRQKKEKNKKNVGRFPCITDFSKKYFSCHSSIHAQKDDVQRIEFEAISSELTGFPRKKTLE